MKIKHKYELVRFVCCALRVSCVHCSQRCLRITFLELLLALLELYYAC